MERSALITVETVEREYAEDAAYDMEAAGFYPIAWHASTAELVQSLKVISDHPGDLVADLDLHRIEGLIGDSTRNPWRTRDGALVPGDADI